MRYTLTLSLLLGIFSGTTLNGLLPSFALSAVVVVVFLFVFLVRNTRLQQCMLTVCTFCIGMTIVTMEIESHSRHWDEKGSCVMLTSSPVISKTGKVFYCDGVMNDGAKIMLFFHRGKDVDDMTLPSKGETIETSVAIEKGRDAMRMMAQGYDGTLFLFPSSWHHCSVSGEYAVPLMSKVKSLFSGIRQRLLSEYSQHDISGEEYAVIAAMSLGDKSSLSQELRESYSRSGASHVLALSGMHIGIIFFVISFIMIRVGKLLSIIPDYLYLHLSHMRVCRLLSMCFIDYRLVKSAVSFLAVLLVWMYVVLVGVTPSVVRAATMLSVYAVAHALSRKAESVAVLSIAAMLILLLSPLSIYDIGFVMSFMAVLGIALFYKTFSGFLYKLLPVFSETDDVQAIKNKYISEKTWCRCLRWITVWLWNGISLSLAAQIMVAPLVVYYFGYISCYSVLTSIVVSVLASLLVIGSLLVLVLSLLSFHLIAGWFATLLSFFARVQNAFLSWVAGLPGSSFDDLNIVVPQLIVVYIAIACLCAIFRILFRSGN